MGELVAKEETIIEYKRIEAVLVELEAFLSSQRGWKTRQQRLSLSTF